MFKFFKSEKITFITVLRFLTQVMAGVALLAPLMTASWTSFPDIAKVAYFQTIVEVAVVLFTCLAIFDRSARPPWRNPILLTMLAYIGIQILLLPWSVDITRSIWSERWRMGGLLVSIHLFAWFIVIVSVFRKWKEWRWLILGVTGAGLVVGISSLIQSSQTGVTALAGTLNNSSFFGAFMLLASFAAALSAWWVPQRWAKIMLGLLAANLAIMSLFSTSRICLVGLVMAIAVVTISIFGRRLSRMGRIIMASGTVVLLVLLLVGGAWLRFDRPEWSKAHLPRIVQKAIFADPGQDRLSLWRIALLGAGDRPFSGWGVGNYEEAFNRHYDPIVVDRTLSSPWFDSAHNRFMEDLVTTGWLGLIADLAFWSVLALILVRLWRRKPNDAWPTMATTWATAGIIFYWMFAMITVESPWVMLLFLIWLALVTRMGIVEIEDKSATHPNYIEIVVIILIVLTVTVISASFNYRVINVVRLYEQSQSRLADADVATNLLSESLFGGGWLADSLTYTAVDTLNSQRNRYGRIPTTHIDYARLVARQSIATAEGRTNNFRLNAWGVAGLKQLGQFEKGAALAAERQAYQMMLTSPRRQIIYAQLSDLSRLRNDWQQSVVWDTWAVMMAPPAGRALLAEQYFRLATSLSEVGRLKEAGIHLIKARSTSNKLSLDIFFLDRVVKSAWRHRIYESWIEDLAKEVIKNKPENETARQALIICAQLRGDEETVIRLLKQMRARGGQTPADRLEKAFGGDDNALLK